MSPKTKHKINALKRILHTLDGEPVPVPGANIPFFPNFKEGYIIAREDLEIFDEYRDIPIREIYEFRNGKIYEIHRSHQYTMAIIGNENSLVYYVGFHNVPEEKIFLNRIIGFLEWGTIK